MPSVYEAPARQGIDKCTIVRENGESIRIYQRDDGSVNLVRDSSQMETHPYVIINKELVKQVGEILVNIGQ